MNASVNRSTSSFGGVSMAQQNNYHPSFNKTNNNYYEDYNDDGCYEVRYENMS